MLGILGKFKKGADEWMEDGLAAALLGKYDEAISCFDEVIRIDPDDFLARYNKAMALEALGRFSEAKKCLDGINRS